MILPSYFKRYWLPGFKRKMEALRLHRQGAKLKSIGSAFGVSGQQARVMVNAAQRYVDNEPQLFHAQCAEEGINPDTLEQTYGTNT